MNLTAYLKANKADFEFIEIKNISAEVVQLPSVRGLEVCLLAPAAAAAAAASFEDLGMEAIYEFEVQDMPVTVAVDSSGEAVHKSGPAFWQREILKMNIAPRHIMQGSTVTYMVEPSSLQSPIPSDAAPIAMTVSVIIMAR